MAKQKPPAEKKPEQPQPSPATEDTKQRIDGLLATPGGDPDLRRAVEEYRGVDADKVRAMTITEEAPGAVPLTPESREKIGALDLTTHGAVELEAAKEAVLRMVRTPEPSEAEVAAMKAQQAVWRKRIATVGDPLRAAAVAEGIQAGDVAYMGGGDPHDPAAGLIARTDDGKQLLRLLAGQEPVEEPAPVPLETVAGGHAVSQEALEAYRAESLHLGNVGFDAYGNHPGPAGAWKTFDGRPMPTWIALGEPGNVAGPLTRERWGVAARAIIDASPEKKLLGELLEALVTRVGERGDSEGAVDVLKRLIREGRTDGRAFNLGRSEGRADVAAQLRRIVDPRDTEHLSLDGALDKVRRLNALRAQLSGERKGTEEPQDTLRRVIEQARDAGRVVDILGALPEGCQHAAALVVREVKPERYDLLLITHQPGRGAVPEQLVEDGPWSLVKEERAKALDAGMTPKSFQE